MARLSIRPLRPEEWPLVAQLRISETAQAYLSSDWLNEALAPHMQDWGTWIEDQLIGWCRLVGHPPTLWVGRILIDAPYSGLGYGTTLLRTVIGATRRYRRYEELRAAIHPENVIAMRFFQKMGFERLPYEEVVGEVVMRLLLR